MRVASCLCQAVRIEVAAVPSYFNQCHCSVCRRYGTLWGYYQVQEVHMLGALDATEFYARGEKNLEFHRCRTCGCITHWQDTDRTQTRMAINGRLFEEADVAAVPVKQSPGPQK